MEQHGHGKVVEVNPTQSIRETSGHADGTLVSASKAKQIIYPTLRRVRQVMQANGAPEIPGWSNRLFMWFQRLVRGNRIDDRTPFYSHLSWFSIRKALAAMFNSDTTLRLLPTFARDGYVDVEKDQLDDTGPKSEYVPWEWSGKDKLKAVMSDKPKLKGFNDSAWVQALTDVSDALPKGSIAPISQEEALKGMGGMEKFALDDSTNGGFPAYVSNWAHLNREKDANNPVMQKLRLEQFLYLKSRTAALISASKKGPFNQPFKVHFVGTTGQRTVSKGLTPLKPNDKGVYKNPRVVIAMPKEEVWAGKTLMAPAQPALLSKFRNASGIPIIAGWLPQPKLDKAMQMLLESAEKSNRTVLSGDISAFDASLPPWAMWDVAQAISEWFSPEGKKLFLSILRADIYDTEVIAPDGITPAQPSSVKSGSIFTSLMGCMCNYAIQRYGHHCGIFTVENQCVMGDDFVVEGEDVTPENMERAFAAFGMECNASKQFYRRGMLHFLQRLHILGYPGGIGSLARIGGGALVVEDDTQIRKDERNPYTFIFQALARLENAAFNPGFEQLVDWLAKGDVTYHLGKHMSFDEILRRSGSYAERKMNEARNRPWTSTGSGVPFEHWSVNRVLRGESMPPLGKARFEFVYGVSYDSISLA